jgi:DNA-binding CsgD family transcriptional regulator
MVATSARAAFVGRTRELDRLRAAADRARAAEGTAILCFGEAGIGKSRLADEFARRCRDADIPVLVGGCVESGGAGLPYGPFPEALRMAVRSGAIVPERLHAQTRDQLALLVPEFQTRARRASATERASRGGRSDLGQVPLFEAILAAIESAAQPDGLVLVIEDVHWADRSTMDLLAFLTRNLASVGLLLVVTVRSDALDRRDPLAVLVAELTRRPGVERLDLAPLDLEATTAQLRSVLGFDPEPGLARRIHQRSDGNPFFVEQLAQAHLDGEAAALPPSLRDLLLSQLSRLPADVQRLLAAVAIAGPQADEAMLAAMLDLREDEVIDRLRVAVDQHVLVASPPPHERYEFHHALVAEAAESDLLEGERRHLHARCADRLEQERPADGAELAQWAGRVAYHRERSGERLQAIRASIEAGLAAEGVAAPSDAYAHYRLATERLRPTEPVPYAGWDRVELFGRAGTAAALAGDPKAAARLVQAAIGELPDDADPFLRGGLLVRYAEYLWTSADDGFVDALRAAADVIPADPPTAVRSDALASLGFYHQYRGDGAAAEQAFAESRATAVAAGTAHNEHALACIGLAVFRFEAGDRLGGDLLLVEAYDVVRRTIVEGRTSAAWMNLVGIYGWSGSDVRAVEIAEEGLASTRAAGLDAYYGSLIAANGAEALLSLGRPRDGLALLGSVATVSSGGYLDTAYLGSRVAMLVALGESEAARNDLDSIGSVTSTGDQSLARYLAVVEAEWLVQHGDPTKVCPIVSAALRLPATHIPGIHENATLVWLAARAEADLAERARARRDDAAVESGAARVARLLADLDDAIDAAPPRSSVTMAARAYRCLADAESGRLAGRADPDQWLAASAAFAGRSGRLRIVYARIREAEARLALGRADRAAAAELLAAAHREAVAADAQPLVEMATDLARRARVELGMAPAKTGPSGVALDRPTRDGAQHAAVRAYGLTERELEILSLLAAGLTNRQIGEHLYISPKTAGVHVSNLLGKLGVSGRVQAATLAHHLGIRPPDDLAELTA